VKENCTEELQQKQIQQKSQVFLNNIKNIFQELNIETQKNNEKLSVLKQTLMSQGNEL